PALLFTRCSGLANSSSTLTFQYFGTTTSSCTDTTVSSNMRMPSAGTLQNLYVVAAVAGVNASSGVVTVYKCIAANQPACTTVTSTGITCTIGTGKQCSDLTHTAALVQGDGIIIKMTTQASETLNDITVS